MYRHCPYCVYNVATICAVSTYCICRLHFCGAQHKYFAYEGLEETKNNTYIFTQARTYFVYACLCICVHMSNTKLVISKTTVECSTYIPSLILNYALCNFNAILKCFALVYLFKASTYYVHHITFIYIVTCCQLAMQPQLHDNYRLYFQLLYTHRF